MGFFFISFDLFDLLTMGLGFDQGWTGLGMVSVILGFEIGYWLLLLD